MSSTELLDEFSRLPLSDRLDLVHALWESIVEADADQLPLSDAHRELLRERLEQSRANPTAGRPWREVLEDVEREL